LFEYGFFGLLGRGASNECFKRRKRSPECGGVPLAAGRLEQRVVEGFFAAYFIRHCRCSKGRGTA